MLLTFKQFFSAVLLRIFPIQNLEPRTLLSFCDVRSRFLLGNDALQVQFADSLKQGSPAAVNVFGIFQQRIRCPCQQPPKFLLAVQQSLSPQIFPFTGQQIECKEARRVPTAKHQISELWSTTSVEGANFAVNYCSCVRQASRDLLSKLREGSEWMPVAREQLSFDLDRFANERSLRPFTVIFAGLVAQSGCSRIGLLH